VAAMSNRTYILTEISSELEVVLCIVLVIMSLVQNLGRGAPGSVVSIATGLPVGQFGVQILPGASFFLFFKNVQPDCGSHPTPYSMGRLQLKCDGTR